MKMKRTWQVGDQGIGHGPGSSKVPAFQSFHKMIAFASENSWLQDSENHGEGRLGILIF